MLLCSRRCRKTPLNDVVAAKELALAPVGIQNHALAMTADPVILIGR